jgi:predicted RNase H-like HicB family nuclease
MRTFTAVVERCPDTGLYVGYIPGFPGAHTQAETLDELQQDISPILLRQVAKDIGLTVEDLLRHR